MELVDATGTVRGEATFVSGDALGQRFTYKLANPPAEDFDGKLILTTTGKDTPDASPKTIKVSVKFVALPGPTVTKTYPTDQPERIGKFDIEGGGQTFEGEHLAGASLTAKYTGQSGTAYEKPIDASEFTVEDDRIVIAGGEGSQWAGIAATVNADYPFKVEITTPDGTADVPLES